MNKLAVAISKVGAGVRMVKRHRRRGRFSVAGFFIRMMYACCSLLRFLFRYTLTVTAVDSLTNCRALQIPKRL